MSDGIRITLCPFELPSLYQGHMWAMCGECKKMNLLELSDVLDE